MDGRLAELVRVAVQLVVPAYTSMAAQIRSHRDAEREEQNVLKQRVLQVSIGCSSQACG